MLNVGEILLRFAHDQLDYFLCDRYRIIDMSFTSMNPTDETTSSSFLSLPGEIRNVILRLLLTHKTSIVIYRFGALKPPRPVTLKLQPNILQACRLTYNEGRTILYGENVFQAHHMLLKGAVFAVDPDQLIFFNCIEMVRRFHIRVRADIDAFYLPSQVEAAFDGTEILEVEVFRSSFEAGGHGALHCFAGVRGVEKAKVHGSVDDKFARWLERCMMSTRGQSISEFGAQSFEISNPISLDTTVR